MQQTQTYKLNLIEHDDNFSPEPLNENAQKLETALSGAEAQLDRRLAALEARRLVTGTYTGTGENATQTIQLGFTPILVYVCGARYGAPQGVIALSGKPLRNNFTDIVKIVPGGFTVAEEFNYSNYTQYYAAIL